MILAAMYGSSGKTMMGRG